jgi:ABC-type amino acid transport substrate-binding protein
VRGFTIDLSSFGETRPHLIEASAERDLFTLLLRGRVEAVYTNVAVMRAFLAREGYDRDVVTFRSDLPYGRSHYSLSSVARPDLIRLFNRWLSANEGRVAALQRKHRIELPAADIGQAAADEGEAAQSAPQ